MVTPRGEKVDLGKPDLMPTAGRKLRLGSDAPAPCLVLQVRAVDFCETCA